MSLPIEAGGSAEAVVVFVSLGVLNLFLLPAMLAKQPCPGPLGALHIPRRISYRNHVDF